MNLEKLNHWLALVANIGVLVGIFFLASEIQLSREATLAELYQSRSDTRSDGFLKTAYSAPDFFETLFMFESDLEEIGPEAAVAKLDPKQLFALQSYYSSRMVRIDNVVLQRESGFVPDSYFQGVEGGLVRIMPVLEALEVPVTRSLINAYNSIEAVN